MAVLDCIAWIDLLFECFRSFGWGSLQHHPNGRHFAVICLIGPLLLVLRSLLLDPDCLEQTYQHVENRL